MTRPQRIARLRAALRAVYGAGQYRITADGLVRVRVPHAPGASSCSDWYTLGPLGLAEAWLELSPI